MYLDLDSSEGERFQFFASTIDPVSGDVVYGDPKGDAYVTLRPMQPFFEDRLAKRQLKVDHVLNPKTKAMERITYYPDLSFDEVKREREDAWDYAILTWEGFMDEKTKQDIECTRENKIKLMKIPVFDRFIARCFQLMAESGIKEEEALEKN